MGVLGNELGRDGIPRTAGAETIDIRRILGKRISTLDREPIDNTMEEQPIVEPGKRQLGEISLVQRRICIQLDLNRAVIGDNVEYRLLGQLSDFLFHFD